MNANNWNWSLPLLLLLFAINLSLQNDLRHATCDNEERYENQAMCVGKEFGCLVPYPDNCSLYLVCDCIYPTVMVCPGNLWWNNKTRSCNYAQVTECIHYTFTSQTTDVPDVTTASMTSRDTTVYSTPSITKESTVFSTPSTTGDTTVFTTLNTSPLTSTTGQNWPTSSWDPPPPPPGIEESFCRNFPDGSLHPYDYDCNAYINCTYGWPVLNYCPEDKVFNKYMLICDTDADCESIPLPTTTVKPTTTTTEPTTTTLEPTTTTIEPATTTIETTTTTIEPTTTTAQQTTTTVDEPCAAPPKGIEEDYCQSLGNGFYEYPYDCSAYLSCRNGCTNMAYCIPEKLFNPLLHICDTPNSVTCNPLSYPTTTPGSSSSSTAETSTTPMVTESTTAAITTTTAGLPADVDPNDCVGKPDYTLMPYKKDCSQYLQCKDNQVLMGQCPNSMLFNPKLLICDDAESVCCDGDCTTSTTTAEPTTTTTSTTLTTVPITTLGPEQLCANEQFGASFPYVEDCSKYILCFGDGTFYIVNCISGTYFDPKSGQCGNVSPTACKEQDVTTTTTEIVSTTNTPTVPTTRPPTTATTTSPAQPGGICGGKDEGELITYPADCSKYIVCVTPIPVAFYCMEGYFFNVKQQQCVTWQDSDCDKDMSTTPGYTQPPREPTMCTNSTRKTFPYPDNCKWFIRCVDDYIYMTDVCNCGEYYDPISGECGADVPPDACRWDYTSTTTPEPSTESAAPPVTRPPPQKGPCDDAVTGDLVPYPNDCSKYIKCNRPIAAAFDCDEGEEFSPVMRKCMDASEANCSTTPGTAGPSTGTTPSWPVSSTSSDSTSNPAISTTPEISTTEQNPTTESSTTQESSTTEENTSTESSTTQESSTTEASTTQESSTTEASTTQESSTTEPSTTQDTSTTEAITTDRTTTPAPSGGICAGKANNTLVPYPNNCGKYIVCEEPIPVGYDCPAGLEFSPTELKCMDPDSANCRPKPTAGPTTTTMTTTESSSTTPETTPATTEPPTSSTAESTPTITESTAPNSTPTITESTTPNSTPTIPASTTPESTASTTADSTSTITESTTPEPTTTISDSTSTTMETTTDNTSTTPTTTTTIHPDTPNICCGHPLGTILPYPNDCNRYVVCDYPIPYAVVCEEGKVFDTNYLQCTSESNQTCL